jgi:hypothetical protein
METCALPPGLVVFTQLSDGLLEAKPKRAERIVIKKHNAMGAHDKRARVELPISNDDAPIGELRELLYSMLGISRRQRIALHFWGKPLDDDAKTLMDYKCAHTADRPKPPPPPPPPAPRGPCESTRPAPSPLGSPTRN